MPELNKEEQLRKRRGALAKEFMEGDFFLQFLLPYMDDLRMKSYPEPSKKGWEQEYQFAFASDKVLTQLITVIQAWISEGKALSQDENEPEKNIIDA